MANHLGPAPAFYYQTEEQRQHAQYAQQQSYSIAFDPEHMKPLPPNMTFNPHQAPPAGVVYTQASYAQFMPTPVASPQPVSHRPTILIDRQEPRLQPLDTGCSPATPALSASGSTASSPPSACGFLPTPVNGSTPVSDNLVGVKQGCEGEVLSEILAGGDLSRAQSPPLTPSKSTSLSGHGRYCFTKASR